MTGIEKKGESQKNPALIGLWQKKGGEKVRGCTGTRGEGTIECQSKDEGGCLDHRPEKVSEEEGFSRGRVRG